MKSSDWNAAEYQQANAFVFEYGESLLDWLIPKPGEYIVDLGCGTGQLTQAISDSGATVLGLDSSSSMIAQAKINLPQLNFQTQSATTFTVENPCDAVFSNACLHWVHDLSKAFNQIYKALKPGGRFIFEQGGYGNCAEIIHAVETVLNDDFGVVSVNPWTFPTLQEYRILLETVGFKIDLLQNFTRPTTLQGGESGLRQWLNMFANSFFQHLDERLYGSAIAKIETKLRPILWCNDHWTADYHRLRVRAFRTH